MLRNWTKKEKCLFCEKDAVKNCYRITNKGFYLCDRCLSQINLLTNGLDLGCVQKHENLQDEENLLFD